MLFEKALRTLKFTCGRVRADRRHGPSRRGRVTCRPRLECFEDRTLLSTVTWTNASGGDWDTASNWSTGVVPGPGADVVIPAFSPGITVTHSQLNNDSIHSLNVAPADTLSISAGTLSIAAASTIGGPLNLTGATLTGTGSITVSGAMTWSNSTIGGDSTFNVNGGLTIDGTSANEGLDARTLNINATATWSCTNNLYLYDQATVNIASGVTFTVSNAQTIYNGGLFASTINNAGTFHEAPGSGTTTLYPNIIFNNNGTTTISSGTLDLQGGGSASGPFTVASAGTLQFGGSTYHVGSTSGISGAGSATFSAGTAELLGSYTLTGTTNIDGGEVYFATSPSIPRLSLTAGYLDGPGTVTVTGTGATMTWGGGTMSGSETTTIAAGATLNINGASTTETLDTRTLNVAGTADWSNTNSIEMENGAKLNVQSGGSFNVQNDQSIYFGGNGSVQINNAGTFTKSPTTGTTAIYGKVAFNNSGTTAISSGTLDLAGGGTSSGAFSVGTSGTLQFGGPLTTLSSTGSIANAGTVEFSGGSTHLVGSYSGAGTTDVNGGYVDFITGATFPVLNLTSGTLDGPGALALTSTGTATWTNSTIEGNGTLTIPSGASLTIDGSTSETLNLRTVNVAGTATWSGSNNLYVGYGATLNVQSGATFKVETGTNIDNNGGTTAYINVLSGGTLTQSMTSGTTTINIPLNDSGTVNISTGTLVLNAGGQDSGKILPATGATVDFNGGVTFFNTGTSFPTASAGTVDISAGYAEFYTSVTFVTALSFSGGYIYGPGAITVSSSAYPTTMTWSGGEMYGTGPLTISNGGILNITGTSEELDYYTLVNSAGTVNDNNSGSINLSDGAVLTNKLTFTASNAQTVYGGGLSGQFNNYGTLNFTGTGTTAINGGVTFNNSGTVDVEAGTLLVAGGRTDTKTFVVSSGATLDFGGGPNSLGSTSSISGAGNVTFSGGTNIDFGTYTATGILTVTGGYTEFDGPATVTVATLNLTGGSLYGTEAFTISHALNWSGFSWLGGTGTTTINSGATLAITGTSVNEFLDGRTLVNSGIATWRGSNNLYLEDGAVLNNKGTFTVQNDQVISNGGNTPTITNSGTFTVSQLTAGVSDIQVPFNNNGTVTVSTGTLQLDGGGTNTKTYSVSSGATLDFDSGYFPFNTGTNVGGAGTVEVTGADVQFFVNDSMTNLSVLSGQLGSSANLTITGTMVWQNSTLDGLGSYTISAGATLNINGTNVNETIDFPTLNIAGTANWSSTNNIYTQDVATINIESGGHFNAQNDQNIYDNGGNTSVINVQSGGTFTKSPTTGTTSIAVFFNDAGTTTVSSGTLALLTGTSSGSIAIASGATLEFYNGNSTLSSGSRVTGAGTMLVSSGNLFVEGTYNIGGTTSITGGTAYFDTNVTFPTLGLTGGSLAGTGNVTVTGAMTWSDADIYGGGTLTVNAPATLTIDGTDSSVILDARTLDLLGTTNWSGTNDDIYFGDGAVVNNEAGATFKVTNDQTINGYGPFPTFNNAGAYHVTAGTGTSTMNYGVPFNNTGTVTVTSGTLALEGGGNGSGSSAVPSGSTLDFYTGDFSIGSFSGAGTLGFSNSVCTLTGTSTGTATVSVTNATVTFAGNTSTGAFSNSGGDVVVTAGTTLALGGNYSQSSGQTDLDGGTITVPSGGTVTISGGYLDGSGTISAPSNKFTFTNDASLYVGAYSGGYNVIGMLTIDGNYTQGSSATLYIGVGGPAAGQFDVLNIAGRASLAGTLYVYGLNSHSPGPGVHFTVITCASESGAFGTLSGSINGVGYTVAYTEASATLTTT